MTNETKRRIVITVDGGIVQHVVADGSDIEVIIVDYDTEGATEGLIAVRQFDDSYVNAYVSPVQTDNSAKRVAELFELAGADED